MSKVLPSEVRDDKQTTCVEEAEENVGGAVVKHLLSRSQPYTRKRVQDFSINRAERGRRYWKEIKSWEMGGGHHVRCIGHSAEPKLCSRILKGLKSLQS